MKAIDVREYDLVEDEKKSHLSNWIIQAGQSLGFDSIGFPSRIKNISELHRYVDTMHETRVERLINDQLNMLTDLEFSYFLDINKVLAEISQKLFNKRVVAIAPILSAINTFRHIRFLYPNMNATIFEIGSGSGYLGALLIKAGYRYISTDVTQAFYILQSHLFSKIGGDNFYELVNNDESIGDIFNKCSKAIIHLPWWKFYTLFLDKEDFSVDMVTSNHALCEMLDKSRRYVLSIARRLLLKNSFNPTFCYEGIGGEVLAEHLLVEKQFSQYQYALRFNDPLFTVYTPNYVSGGGYNNTLKLRLFKRVNRTLNKLRRDYPFIQNNQYKKAILSGRKSLEKHVGKEDILRSLTQISGIGNYNTMDEKFFLFSQTPH